MLFYVLMFEGISLPYLFSIRAIKLPIFPTVYFGATRNVYSADLPWISRLFCGKRRWKCIAYSTEPPLFGLQTGVVDFPQNSPKDAVKRW